VSCPEPLRIEKTKVEVNNKKLNSNSSAGVGGLCVGILALCKVGFVSGFCVPCNVLKIAWGRVGKVMDA